MEINLSTYKPHSTGMLAHASRADVIYVTGAVGVGKSRWAIEEVQKHILTTPNALVFILRENYTDLTDSTIPDFFELWNPIFCRYPNNVDKSYNKQEHNLQTINGGSVRFRSADRPRKLQSIDKMTMFWLEEAPDVPRETFLFLYTRPRRKDVPLRKILTGYVPDTESWVYDYFWKRDDPQYEKFVFQKEDNAHNLVVGYYENLYRLFSENPDWIKRYLEAEPIFIGRGEAYFPGFNRDIHSISEIIHPFAHVPVMRGWDYGYDWSALCFAQINPFDQLVVLGSMLGHNLDVSEFAPKVQAQGLDWFGGNVGYEDYGAADGEFKSPQSRESVHDQLAHRSIKPVFKAPYPGSMEDGMNIIRRLLTKREDGRPGIVFCGERCGMLINALAGGLDKDLQGRPNKTRRPAIDLVDSLRNMVVNLFDSTLNRPSEVRDSVDERHPRICVGGKV